MLLAAGTRRLVLPGWLSLVRPRKGNHSAGLISSMWEIRKSRVRKHLCPRLPPPALDSGRCLVEQFADPKRALGVPLPRRISGVAISLLNRLVVGKKTREGFEFRV